MLDLQLQYLIKRIKNSPDGEELIKFLIQLSEDNYKEIKKSAPEWREFFVGKAEGIDLIKDLFLNADNIDRKTESPDLTQWSQ